MPIVIGGLIGTVGGLFLLCFAFITAFGICSDTSFAEILFPYALYADPSLFDRPYLALTLALAQYPVYSIVCGWVWVRKQSAFWACLLILLIAHMIAVGGAHYRVKTMWEERLSQTSPR